MTFNEKKVQPVPALENIFILILGTWGFFKWYYTYSQNICFCIEKVLYKHDTHYAVVSRVAYKKTLFYIDNCTKNMKKMKDKTALISTKLVQLGLLRPKCNLLLVPFSLEGEKSEL